MTGKDYVHSFSKEEQDRLIRQGDLLEPYLHKHIDLSGCSNLLEIGCGVGSQIRILLRRHPLLHISGVDIAESQIERARSFLFEELAAGKVALHTSPGNTLPFADGSFDCVYICFVLEHLSDPVAVIQEAKRVLRNGGALYCTEVFNDALYVHPSSPAITQYWRAFNELQCKLGGDPNVGIRLCNLMIEAGLQVNWLGDASYMLDRRMTDQKIRAAYIDHWKAVFLSAKEQLLSANLVAATLIPELAREFSVLLDSQASVFLYSNRQVCARKAHS